MSTSTFSLMPPPTMAKSSRTFILLLLLRLLAVATTVAAAAVMASSHQTILFFGISMGAKFHYNPTFVFFVVANAIAAVYTLLTLFVPPSSSLSKPMAVLDVVIAMLVVAAVSAATAVGEVGRKGNKHAGWQPICGQVPKFCNQVTGAVICGYGGALVYLLIVLRTVISPHNQ